MLSSFVLRRIPSWMDAPRVPRYMLKWTESLCEGSSMKFAPFERSSQLQPAAEHEPRHELSFADGDVAEEFSSVRNFTCWSVLLISQLCAQNTSWWVACVCFLKGGERTTLPLIRKLSAQQSFLGMYGKCFYNSDIIFSACSLWSEPKGGRKLGEETIVLGISIKLTGSFEECSER